MASSRQKYFILRNDIPIGKTNNFLRSWLNLQNVNHVLRGELLVKEAQSHHSNMDSNYCMYSLALDKSKKVACTNSDVAPLSEDEMEWLVAIQKLNERYSLYHQRDKFEAVKKVQVGDKVWVCVPSNDVAPLHLQGSSCCQATVQYTGPLQGQLGRWIGVALKVRHRVLMVELPVMGTFISCLTP